MMMPDWLLAAAGVYFLVAMLAGYLGATVASWSQRSLLYSLQDEVAVLEATLTSEIKRRAALSRPLKEKDDELLEKLKSGGAGQPARQPMWWEQFTGQNGKGA